VFRLVMTSQKKSILAQMMLLSINFLVDFGLGLDNMLILQLCLNLVTHFDVTLAPAHIRIHKIRRQSEQIKIKNGRRHNLTYK